MTGGTRKWKWLAVKVSVGTVIAAFVMLLGDSSCLYGGGFNLFTEFCMPLGYYLRPNVLTYGLAATSILFLFSAFRDVFAALGRITLAERNIEAIGVSEYST